MHLFWECFAVLLSLHGQELESFSPPFFVVFLGSFKGSVKCEEVTSKISKQAPKKKKNLWFLVS